MPLNANFLADFSSFINACKDATTSTDELVEAAGKVGADVDQSIAKAAGSIKQAAVGIADFAKTTYSVLSSSQVKDFVGDVTETVKGFIDEFAEGEAATARLNQALKNSGQIAPDVAAAYAEMATQLQKVSTFSDEAITDAQAVFTTIGKVGPEAMQPTLETAMNLASFLKIDLPAAATMMAKAAQSDGEELGKLKHNFGDVIPEGANFKDIVEILGKQLGGQFKAELETTTGQMANLKNQMSDVNEQIGKVFADNLKSILSLFQQLPEGMQTFIIAVVAIGTAIAPILVSLASVVSLLGSAGLGAALAAAGAAIVPFLPAIAAVAAAVLAVWAVWHYWDDMVALVKKAVDAVRVYLVDVLPAAFKATIETAKQWYFAIKEWLFDKFVAIVQGVIGFTDQIAAAFRLLFDKVVGHSYVPDLMNGIARHFAALDYIMVDPARAAVQAVYGYFSELSDPIKLNKLTRADMLGGGGGWGGSSVGGGAAAGTNVNVTVNMTGMLSADDPQTRAMIADLVSDAVMQGMRGTRLLGTT